MCVLGVGVVNDRERDRDEEGREKFQTYVLLFML